MGPEALDAISAQMFPNEREPASHRIRGEARTWASKQEDIIHQETLYKACRYADPNFDRRETHRAGL